MQENLFLQSRRKDLLCASWREMMFTDRTIKNLSMKSAEKYAKEWARTKVCLLGNEGE
jgi:hypothetical protein